MIHQALPSQFSLLTEFYLRKVPVKDSDKRVLKLVNLNPDFNTKKHVLPWLAVTVGRWVRAVELTVTFLATAETRARFSWLRTLRLHVAFLATIEAARFLGRCARSRIAPSSGGSCAPTVAGSGLFSPCVRHFLEIRRKRRN